MATLTVLNGTSVTSTDTCTLSVTPASGSLLGVAVLINSYPSGSPSISTKTWNGNDLGAVRKSQQGVGATYLLSNIYAYEVASSATANIVIVGGGTYTQISVAAYQITGYNTGAIIGATAGEAVGSATQVFSGGTALATAVGDVVIDGCIIDVNSTDRWLEINSGTTSGYNSDPRPGNIPLVKAASGYVTAAGSTVDIGWLSRIFDSGPIPNPAEGAHAAVVVQTAAAGGTASAFFAYTRNHLTAGAVS